MVSITHIIRVFAQRRCQNMVALLLIQSYIAPVTFIFTWLLNLRLKGKDRTEFSEPVKVTFHSGDVLKPAIQVLVVCINR